MKKMLFLLNPCAGMRKANRSLAQILTVFNRAGYEVVTYITAGQADGAQKVRQMAGCVDLVVCAGGDGTFNETITGLLDSGVDIPVGYIPCGSSNDFAASLQLSLNVVQAAQEIAEGKPVSYDVGKFNGRYFSYVASFGAFTKASYTTPQNIKNILGHTAYILEGIQELSQIRATHVRAVLPDQTVEGDFIFGAVCNATCVGGLLSLDPNRVDLADGKLELLLVRAPKDLMELHGCIIALQKHRYDSPMLTFASAERMEIYADPDMPWTLDGEREPGHSVITIENLHHAIRLMQKEKT